MKGARKAPARRSAQHAVNIDFGLEAPAEEPDHQPVCKGGTKLFDQVKYQAPLVALLAVHQPEIGIQARN